MFNIYLHTSKGLQKIPAAKILRIEASRNYSRIFFCDGTFPLLTSKILNWFECGLSDQGFIRTHKSHLINPLFVQVFCNHTSRILLQTGDSIAVSRRRLKAVNQQLILKKDL